MSDLFKKTKAQLIEEITRLREQAMAENATAGSNGNFDEDELLQMVSSQEGDELFVVTETGRFVFVNEMLSRQLGYSRADLLTMSLSRIDPNNTRAAWLSRASQLKQHRVPDEFETGFIDASGKKLPKKITANYIAWKGKNYILCVCRDSDNADEKTGNNITVKSKEAVLMQTTFDGIIIVDTRGAIVETNTAADRLLGNSKNEIIMRSCFDPRWRLIDADGQPLTVSSHPLMISLVEEHPVLNRKFGIMQPDGSKRFFTINASPLFDHNGELSAAVGCIRPFEDNLERLDALKREISLLKVHAEVMTLIVTARSEDDLERNLCDLLVRQMRYPLVWRGIIKENDKRVYISASAGKDYDYLRKIKIRYDDSELGRGPIGKAVKSGQPVIVHDLLADKDSAVWKQQNINARFYSLAAFPLIYESEDAGVLVLYSRDKNHFSAPEYARLKEIAQMVSFGIGVRKRLKTTAEQLGDAEVINKLLTAYQNSIPVAIAVFEAREPFLCINANAQFNELLDEPFRTHGVNGQMLSDFAFSLYHTDLYDRLVESEESENVLSQSHETFKDWQGQPMIWSWSITPLREKVEEPRFLYLAWKQSHTTTDPSLVQTSTTVSAATALGSESGILSVVYPKINSRYKTETRVKRFLDEGRVTVLNQSAKELLGLEGRPNDPAHEVFPADAAIRSLLEELISLKENTRSLNHKSTKGRVLQITPFFNETGKDWQVWLFIETVD